MTKHTITRISVAVIVAGLAFLAGKATAEAAPMHRCYVENLSVQVTHPSAAAGTAYYRLTFRNEGAAPCSMLGYPGVSAVASPAGPRIGHPATRTAAGSPASVVLEPGQHATAVLGIAAAGNWSRSRCHPTEAAGLRVYPPGDYDAAFVPPQFPACARSRAHVLSVSPVQEG